MNSVSLVSVVPVILPLGFFSFQVFHRCCRRRRRRRRHALLHLSQIHKNNVNKNEKNKLERKNLYVSSEYS